MTRTVAGARIVITGAAMGMGRLYAERAVAEGARDVVLWDRDRAALAQTARELRADAGTRTAIHPYAVDVADMGAIAQTAQKVRWEVGNPDILINNAGIVRGKYFWEHDSGEDIRPTMQVNALAPMYIVREFLPGMIASGREARIVNIASAAAMVPNPRMSVYAASKSSLVGFSDALRVELVQQGYGHVRVTAVAPSFVSTGMFAGVRPPRLTPMLRPERVVDRVWRGMLAGRAMVMLPWTVVLAKTVKGLLPTSAWDAAADGLFRVYGSMATFTGRR